jgi:predicted  nucleic acid-binding Zn-ribbon protein
MLPQIQELLVLQDRDRRLISLREDLARVPKDEARAKDKFSGDTAAVQKAKDAVMANEVEMKKIQLDSGTRKTTIQRLKTQQFETRKNDEFTALGHEVKRYEAEMDVLETRELELMEKGDGLRAVLAAAEAGFAKTKQLVAEDLQSLVERRKRIETELEEVKAEREKLAAKAPEAMMPLYDRLIKNKNGLAVVPVHAGQCTGCHMKLVASTLVKVQGGHDIVQCENCGRILYPED